VGKESESVGRWKVVIDGNKKMAKERLQIGRKERIEE